MYTKSLNIMDNKMKYFLYLPVLILTLYLSGCSELETNIEKPESVNIHKEGILNPSSMDFHGKLISDNNWDMNQCQQCHGSNYDGGLVNVSCFTCHTQPAGPENCSTCHGSETSPAPPLDLNGNTSTTEHGVGAHQVHLAGNLKGKTLSCAECHVVPTSFSNAGHVDSDSPAEAPMNGFLATLKTNDPSTNDYDSGLPLFDPDPAYNSADFSCSNTYCHGTFKNGNTDNAPVWTNPSSSTCGTCHGDPTKSDSFEKALPKTTEQGGSHPGGLDCSICHGGVVDANLKFINVSKHIDGKLNLFGNDVIY